MIEYPSPSFEEECRKAYEANSAFGIQIRKPGRKAAAIRRTLRALDGSPSRYPILLGLIDKMRLIRLWIGMCHALADHWHLAHYEDEQGFEIYLTPPR